MAQPAKQEKNRDTSGKFVKGVSGNPSGRPKGSLSITRHLRAALAAQDEEQAQVLALAIIEQAKTGNSQALKTVMDRIDGPVKEEIDVTYAQLSDKERAERVAALLERAGERRAGSSAECEG